MLKVSSYVEIFRRKIFKNVEIMEQKFAPIDILALVVVVGYFGLLFSGKQNGVEFAFNAIIGFYFGHKVSSSANEAGKNSQKIS